VHDDALLTSILSYSHDYITSKQVTMVGFTSID